MTTTVTVREVFDADGKLVERVTTTTDDKVEAPPLTPPNPWVYPYPNVGVYPNTYPYPQQWNKNTNPCSACAQSGVCNCVLGSPQVYCSNS